MKDFLLYKLYTNNHCIWIFFPVQNVGSTGDVDNFILVSTNGDNTPQQIQLPKGLYVSGKSSTPFECKANEVDEIKEVKEKSIKIKLKFGEQNR